MAVALPLFGWQPDAARYALLKQNLGKFRAVSSRIGPATEQGAQMLTKCQLITSSLFRLWQ